MKSFFLLKIICICKLALFYSANLSAQTLINWETLQDVSYESSYDSSAGFVVMAPVYGQELRALEGQAVEIKGYILPMDTDGSAFVLSAFPFSSCFFCGGASKESVIELEFGEKKAFKVDQIMSFKGILSLGSDPFGLNYILSKAKEVRESD